MARREDEVRTGVERTQNINPQHLLYNVHFRDDQSTAHLSRFARRCLGLPEWSLLTTQPRKTKTAA